MKLKNRAFPYPVIRPGGGISPDYVTSTYSGTVTILPLESESNSNADQYNLTCSHLCLNEDILALIKDGKAKYATLIVSSETFYRELFVCKDAEQVVPFSLDRLYGRVEIEPYIVITESVNDFSSADMDVEYGDATFTLEPGDILAVGKTKIEHVEFSNTSVESLIRVRDGDDSVDPDHYRIENDDYYIYICMGRNFRRAFELARSESAYRPYLALSVYKDAFFYALWELSRDDDGEERHWARALLKRVDELDYTLENNTEEIGELNEIAQAIVSAEGIKKLKLGLSDESIDD